MILQLIMMMLKKKNNNNNNNNKKTGRHNHCMTSVKSPGAKQIIGQVERVGGLMEGGQGVTRIFKVKDHCNRFSSGISQGKTVTPK